MKRTLLIMAGLLLVATMAFAGTISGSGMYQKDLHSLLQKLVTMVNELKADHNNVISDIRAASGVYASYSASIRGRTTTSSDLSLTQ